jgi:hypothetical protein
MSIVNFISGINNIEQQMPLSEWAVEFIRIHSLLRENFTAKEAFRKLPRREKDAIRYQLRKGSPSSKRHKISSRRIQFTSKSLTSPKRIIPNLRLVLSLWISCFLLYDLVQIYLGKGLSVSFAWQAAILVEVCVLVASLSHEVKVRRIAYAFFAYNAALFGFSEINYLSKLSSQNSLNSHKLSEAYEKKAEFTNSLKNLNTFRNKSLSEMSKLVGKGYVSSVSNAVSKINAGLRISEQITISELKTLENVIIEYESKQPNLYVSGLISFLYFFLRCALQLFSIWLLKKAPLNPQFTIKKEGSFTDN